MEKLRRKWYSRFDKKRPYHICKKCGGWYNIDTTTQNQLKKKLGYFICVYCGASSNYEGLTVTELKRTEGYIEYELSEIKYREIKNQ